MIFNFIGNLQKSRKYSIQTEREIAESKSQLLKPLEIQDKIKFRLLTFLILNSSVSIKNNVFPFVLWRKWVLKEKFINSSLSLQKTQSGFIFLDVYLLFPRMLSNKYFHLIRAF